MYKVAVIAGDGVGPEVIREALKVARLVIRKYKVPLEFEEFPYGAGYYLETGISVPGTVFTQWPQEYAAVLLGALGDPRVKSNVHAEEILMGFRRKLDLYVNFRPVTLLDKNYCPLKHVAAETQVDFIVFRENTEDIYAGIGGILKGNTDDEVAIENSIHTYKGVERIIRAAFEYARETGRPSVVMGHKSNAMKYAGALWHRVFTKVGEEFPAIGKRTMYIDALCMDILRNPSHYSVIVTTNMFGDILTDIAAQVQGGMGLAASINYNPGDKRFLGVFEPVHGSAPDIAGKGTANPLAAVLSCRLLFQRLGYAKEARVLYRAAVSALQKGKVTPDLGGTLSTSGLGDFLCSEIEEDPSWE